MIRSMTGYSSVRVEEESFSLSVSLKSTNHRSLDIQVRVPPGLDSLDPFIRRLVKEHVARGHLELTVGLEPRNRAGVKVDRQLLAAYVEALREVRKEFGSSAEPDVVALLRIPGMVAIGNGEISAEELSRIQETLERVAGEALGRLNEMREKEGASLGGELRKRLARVAALREEIVKHAADIPRLYQRRLEGRIRALIQELPGGPALDSGRMTQEVALLASHSDISEELERLASHLEQSRHLLEGAGEVGKRLDFLLQEMNREATTLLAKTTDVPEVGVEIARQAIEIKAEIEKLREQAQNIE